MKSDKQKAPKSKRPDPAAQLGPIGRFVSLDADLAATLPRVLPLATPPAGSPDG